MASPPFWVVGGTVWAAPQAARVRARTAIATSAILRTVLILPPITLSGASGGGRSTGSGSDDYLLPVATPKTSRPVVALKTLKPLKNMQDPCHAPGALVMPATFWPTATQA